MKIALTGGTGFIGRFLMRRLLNDGHEVRALVRPGRASALSPSEHPNLEVHVSDLTDKEAMQGFQQDANYTIHLASAHDHFTQEQMQAVNVTGSEILVEDARARAAKGHQFILVSSAVIGMPVYSYYRDSKRVQEKIFRGSGLPWVSFRPTLVYGREDYRHTAPLLRKCGAEKGSYWIPHEGLSKINPVHVDDMVEAIVLFFDYERGKEDYRVYEIAGPEGISFNEFVDTCIRVTGGKVKRRNIPRKWVQRAIFLKGLIMDVTKERRGAGYFSLHHEHDIGPAQEELGWKPRTFQEGILEVAEGDWWKTDEGSGEANALGTSGV